jgi:hypothetical protein
VGQSDFAHSQGNDDNQDDVYEDPTSRVFGWPYHLFSNGTQLFVEDNNNSRILIWNEIPTKNFSKADVVIGQENFTSGNGTTTARTLMYPSGITLYGNQLLVSDTSNSRVLIFNGE